eukprot:79610_1
MAQIDENGDGVIDFDEFQHAFGMITNLNDLVTHWSNMNCIDVGSDLSIGSGLSKLSLFPIIAGGCGGLMSKTATAPLERLKILAQTGKTTESFFRTFEQIIERQGFWGGLWKGNLYACLRIFPFAGSVTFTYSLFLKHIVPKRYKDRIDNPRDPAANIWRFCAGLTAGCIATTITYPLDLMKANEATDMTQTKGVKKPKQLTSFQRLKCSVKPVTIVTNFQKEMKENNIRTFKDAFRGLLPTIFAVGGFIGIQNMSYDALRIYLTHENYLDWTPSIQLFAVCGCTAGLIAQSVCYPMDVIRRRIQTDTMWDDPKKMSIRQSDIDMYSKQRMSRTWINGIVNMIRIQGLKPLFAGLTPTYLKIMPSVAISVTTRDILLGRLNKD